MSSLSNGTSGGAIEIVAVDCIHWMNGKRCSCSLGDTLQIECMNSISRQFVVAQKETNNALWSCTLEIQHDTTEIVLMLQSKITLNSRIMESQRAENASCAATKSTRTGHVDRMAEYRSARTLDMIENCGSLRAMPLNAWS